MAYHLVGSNYRILIGCKTFTLVLSSCHRTKAYHCASFADQILDWLGLTLPSASVSETQNRIFSQIRKDFYKEEKKIGPTTLETQYWSLQSIIIFGVNQTPDHMVDQQFSYPEFLSNGKLIQHTSISFSLGVSAERAKQWSFFGVNQTHLYQNNHESRVSLLSMIPNTSKLTVKKLWKVITKPNCCINLLKRHQHILKDFWMQHACMQVTMMRFSAALMIIVLIRRNMSVMIWKATLQNVIR